MYLLLKYMLILSIIQLSRGCEPYYKVVDRDIDENSPIRYPWLVVIRNIRDSVFGLSYGSLIHPKAVLTSSLGLVGHTKDDIVVETNCKETDLLGILDHCIVRNVSKIIHQSDPENLSNIDKTYDILILEASFDLTDRIKPITLASDTKIFLENNCLYTRWMREYSKPYNRTGLVTVAYHTLFNNGQLDIGSLDENQLAFDKDWIISRSYHIPFTNVTDKHLLNFIGSPLVCKFRLQSLERYVQVGIANFRLTIDTPNNFQNPIEVAKKGTLINIIPLYSEIIQKVNENL